MATERKTFTKEDFQRKPNYEIGDWVWNSWRSEEASEWKKLSKLRLQMIANEMAEVVDLYPSHFGNEITCWKVTIKSSGLSKEYSGLPAEGYVKIPAEVEKALRGTLLAQKVGVI